MGKIMWDTIVLGDLMFDNGIGSHEEVAREWDDFGQDYPVSPDGFTSILTAI